MIRSEKHHAEDDLLKRFELGLPMEAPLSNRGSRPTAEERKRMFGTDRDPARKRDEDPDD